MRQFQLTDQAARRLRAIGRHTESSWGKAQRVKYLGALYTCFYVLAQSPQKGHAQDHLRLGLRSYREGKHIVFYVTQNDEIIIIDILHERMDPALHLRIEH